MLRSDRTHLAFITLGAFYWGYVLLWALEYPKRGFVFALPWHAVFWFLLGPLVLILMGFQFAVKNRFRKGWRNRLLLFAGVTLSLLPFLVFLLLCSLVKWGPQFLG